MEMAGGTHSLAARYAAQFPLSGKFYEQARDLFPAGVTHDLRYLTPFPIYVDRALGAHKWDVDGHELIDFWSGHGAMLLGHGHPEVVQAVQRQMEPHDASGGVSRIGDRLGRMGPQAHLLGREAAIRGVGHGSDAHGPAALAHLHRQAQGAQVCRALSRLARLPYHRVRASLRPGHAGCAPGTSATSRSSCRRTIPKPSIGP